MIRRVSADASLATLTPLTSTVWIAALAFRSVWSTADAVGVTTVAASRTAQTPVRRIPVFTFSPYE